MSVSHIRARIECDNCGGWFDVELDTGADIPNNWDLMEVATDAVRGGRIADAMGVKVGGYLGFCSVDDDGDGDMLCAKCTAEADAAQPSPQVAGGEK